MQAFVSSLESARRECSRILPELFPWELPLPRICLRKGCGRKYLPRRWNQRYCQDPECLREVRRWQAARRQAKRRQDIPVKAQHAQAEKERRQRAKAAPKAMEN